MYIFFKYYEKWNICSSGANVSFSIIFSNLLKCKKYFLKNIKKFELLIEMMQCSKYSIWGKGLKQVRIFFEKSYLCLERPWSKGWCHFKNLFDFFYPSD